MPAASARAKACEGVRRHAKLLVVPREDALRRHGEEAARALALEAEVSALKECVAALEAAREQARAKGEADRAAARSEVDVARQEAAAADVDSA